MDAYLYRDVEKITIAEIVQHIMLNPKKSFWHVEEGEIAANIGFSPIARLSGKITLQNSQTIFPLAEVIGEILDKISTGLILTIDEI